MHYLWIHVKHNSRRKYWRNMTQRLFKYLFSSVPLITCVLCGSNSRSGTRSSNKSNISQNNNSSNNRKNITYDKMISVVSLRINWITFCLQVGFIIKLVNLCCKTVEQLSESGEANCYKPANFMKYGKTHCPVLLSYLSPSIDPGSANMWTDFSFVNIAGGFSTSPKGLSRFTTTKSDFIKSTISTKGSL